ncbi:MAG: SDR family oxidoreductase [Flavobacteriales bacterium]|nr:SDR family oxidoreductase [Flavobacteriales bacterium]
MSTEPLQGQRALVCGATQGIGRAVAMALAGEGARVTVLARKAEALAQVVAALPGEGHRALPADLSETASLEEAVGKALADGPFTILVNNAGGPPPGPAHRAVVPEFEQAFRLHLFAFHSLVRLVLPGMREAGHGRIVNIISTSVKQPLPDLGVSNTVRASVANWAKTLANELGPWNITVNNVLPGATATERLEAIIRAKAERTGASEEEVAAHMRAEVPLRRFARPEEVAAAVAFLAGPGGSYISGINLPVDGGRTACL